MNIDPTVTARLDAARAGLAPTSSILVGRINQLKAELRDALRMASASAVEAARLRCELDEAIEERDVARADADSLRTQGADVETHRKLQQQARTITHYQRQDERGRRDYNKLAFALARADAEIADLRQHIEELEN